MTLLRERERSDDNDARAFLLSNTAEERIESLGPLHRIAPESFLIAGRQNDPARWIPLPKCRIIRYNSRGAAFYRTLGRSFRL